MILTAEVKQRTPVLGRKGQLLGHVTGCRLEAESQTVVSLLLETPWQVLELPCEAIAYDGHHEAFRVIGSRTFSH